MAFTCTVKAIVIRTLDMRLLQYMEIKESLQVKVVLPITSLASLSIFRINTNFFFLIHVHFSVHFYDY